MKLNDIHFCLGYVLGKRDKYFSDFILGLKDLFIEEEYPRQELQRVLYRYYLSCNIAPIRWGESNNDNPSKRKCFRFIKHTIRSHKNY